MATDPVTPLPGLTSSVATGGTPVNVSDGGDNGGFVQNPASAADQGLGSAEDLIINPVTAAADPNSPGIANGTNFRVPPGGTWQFIAGQTTPTSVNAATTGHKFSVVRF